MTTYPTSPFRSSRARFDALTSKLTGPEAAELDHGALERLVESDGRELLRALVDDHLALRTEREKAAVAPLRGADGVLLTEVRHTSRKLGTLFGDVGVQRVSLVKHEPLVRSRPAHFEPGRRAMSVSRAPWMP